MLQREEVRDQSYRFLLLEESVLTVKDVLSTHISNTDQNVAALQKSDEVPLSSLDVEQLRAELASGCTCLHAGGRQQSLQQSICIA